jgi:tetratricopeptide (TPR) repeat protein
VLEVIAEGGMGVVYRARQWGLNRLVALKMIRGGDRPRPDLLARIRIEAEAVAQLKHPNIVQIYEIGEADGLPFLSLELLEGGTLDSRLAGNPQPGRMAAELMATLARAIQAAHDAGIIHRDLKPSNVLFTSDGIPRITDFGLAKRLESDSRQTDSGQIMGTPCYMAPEQASGHAKDVGPAADVYGLGAILYQVLTGRPPFKGDTPMETVRQVIQDDVVPPSRLVPKVARDVETICLHCLEKAPARRYPTAQALADDLRRYLSGEAIVARSTPAWERGLKWSRRHPGLAAAFGVGTAAVFLLLAGGFYYNARLQAALREAVRERNITQKNLEELVFGLQDKLGETPTTRALRQGLLQEAISGLEDIARRTEAAKPDLSRAVAHRKLGDIFRQIDRAADARDQYERSRRLAEDLSGDGSDPAVADCLARAYLGLGQLSVMARPAEAQAYLRRSVDLFARVEAAVPPRGRARRGPIEAAFQLGRAYGFDHEYAEAEKWFRTSLDRADRWLGEEPQNTRASDMLASSYRKIADMRKLVNDLAGARSDYLEAIALGERLTAAEPGNTEFLEHLALCFQDLAGVTSRMGRPGEARTLLERAEQLFTRVIAADPEALESQLRLALVWRDLAVIARDESRFAAAADYFRRSLDELLRLQDQGKLAGSRFSGSRLLRTLLEEAGTLREEAEACRDAPLALGDLAALRARPAGEAIRLLSIRARLSAARGRVPEVVEAVAALRDLEPGRAEDLYAQARGLGLCLGYLDAAGGRGAGSPSKDRQLLRQSCLERSRAALDRAARLGLRDLSRIEADDALAPLRRHPGYPELISRLKGQSPPARQAGQGR